MSLLGTPFLLEETPRSGPIDKPLWRASGPQPPRPRSAHRIASLLLAPRPALGTPECCQILVLAPAGGWEVGVSETDNGPLRASPGPRP